MVQLDQERVSSRRAWRKRGRRLTRVRITQLLPPASEGRSLRRKEVEEGVLHGEAGPEAIRGLRQGELNREGGGAEGQAESPVRYPQGRQQPATFCRRGGSSPSLSLSLSPQHRRRELTCVCTLRGSASSTRSSIRRCERFCRPIGFPVRDSDDVHSKGGGHVSIGVGGGKGASHRWSRFGGRPQGSAGEFGY